jgi:hypothetical protein
VTSRRIPRLRSSGARAIAISVTPRLRVSGRAIAHRRGSWSKPAAELRVFEAGSFALVPACHLHWNPSEMPESPPELTHCKSLFSRLTLAMLG